MMYLLLILFFGSLAGITFMMGRKFMLIQNGQIINFNRGEIFSESQYLKELKHTTIKNTKKHGYFLLVTTIRIYFRSANILKNEYAKTKKKLKEVYQKRSEHLHKEKIAENSFLKMVSEYKHKIRKIKQQVKEEDNL